MVRAMTDRPDPGYSNVADDDRAALPDSDPRSRRFNEADRSSFGYRDVDLGEKVGLVRGVFSSVAESYDLMNDLMSVGVHRLWKDQFVRWLNPRPGSTVLDVAGGTGDIAFRVRDHTRGQGEVVVCDLTPDMLRVGRDRAIDRGLLTGLSWTAGDAEALPIAARSVDAYTIAFGMRNVPRIEQVLAEAHRVLRPGGRFMCLEFSQVVLPLLSELYDLYSFNVLPRLGELVARDRESYQYLVESIRRFPPQEELAQLMREAGFQRVTYRNLSAGIAAIHSGWRL
jgi:demethylmenaquinone methyltransferase/2-methoxy-6-polyprenyl-1,4-benzoquinol methylase